MADSVHGWWNLSPGNHTLHKIQKWNGFTILFFHFCQKDTTSHILLMTYELLLYFVSRSIKFQKLVDWYDLFIDSAKWNLYMMSFCPYQSLSAANTIIEWINITFSCFSGKNRLFTIKLLAHEFQPHSQHQIQEMNQPIVETTDWDVETVANVAKIGTTFDILSSNVNSKTEYSL